MATNVTIIFFSLLMIIELILFMIFENKIEKKVKILSDDVFSMRELNTKRLESYSVILHDNGNYQAKTNVTLKRDLELMFMSINTLLSLMNIEVIFMYKEEVKKGIFKRFILYNSGNYDMNFLRFEVESGDTTFLIKESDIIGKENAK